VHPIDRPRSTIDALLEDAYITVGFDEDHTPTAAERIARAGHRTEPDEPLSHEQQAHEQRAHEQRACKQLAREQPAHEQLAHEQLAHELDLTCTLVLNTANAAVNLSRLVDDVQCIDPEGALVFGCLLHLTGHGEACRFWWQFAAGGDSHTAAYCLYLYHGRCAEFRDADYWRRQAAALRARDRGKEPPRPVSLQGSLLPKRVLRDILAQCHRGARPHLPQPLETLIHGLKVDCDDDDFGEIPQPSPLLACALASRS
jgi:hypothetical protein